MYNQRIRILKLIQAAGQLAMHGPAKAPDKQGLDEVHEKAGEAVEKGTQETAIHTVYLPFYTHTHSLSLSLPLYHSLSLSHTYTHIFRVLAQKGI